MWRSILIAFGILLLVIGLAGHTSKADIISPGPPGPAGPAGPPGESSIYVFGQTAPVTVVNTTTETSIITTGTGSPILQPGFFEVGDSLVITAWGYWTDTINPTLRVRIKLGGTTVFDSGANRIASNVSPAQLWHLRAELAAHTTGVSGSLTGQGFVIFSTTPITHVLASFAPMQTPVLVNTTIPQLLDVTVQWGTASPSNKLVVTNLVLE